MAKTTPSFSPDPTSSPSATPMVTETLTVPQALQTLNELEGLEPAMYRRAQGITWMIWGLVTPGIFVTFGMFGQMMDGNMPPYFPFLWLPWVAGGALATFALWRTAHIRTPKKEIIRRGRLEFGVRFVIFFALFFLGFMVYQGVIEDRSDLREPGYVLALLGLGYLLLTLARPVKGLPEVRTVVITVSLAYIATSLLLAFVVPYADIDQAYIRQTIVGAVVGGVTPLLGGLYLTTKG